MRPKVHLAARDKAHLLGLDERLPHLIVKYMLNYQANLDLAFQALADPARRTMMDRLAAGPASVSELARPLPMSLPAVMLHLKVLEESGLVQSEKAGRVRTCRLAPNVLSEAEHWITERRQMWERNLDRLGAFLDQTKPETEK
ncbi:MAG TPA: metalloregulator ArsR/SmtB family transcription factor [Rhizomicrobium sp.]|jgi:DNA-binding transcriptional ArsR family regulator|nr:metalloregulator ArsR/SmtB family transcription factor [Rhizomicrobium sp.]